MRELGLRAGIVSNGWYTSNVQRRRIASLGIADSLYNTFVCSADVARVKPGREPFERAIAELGIEAEEAVFVGDDLECDVRGAKALGMTIVWKLNGRHEVAPEPEADYTIHDLWELFTLGLLPQEAGAALPQESLMPHEDANADRY